MQLNNKSIQIIQYIMLVGYVLIFLFVTIGKLKIDVDIYYIQAPESGFNGKIDGILKFGLIEKLLICFLTLLEAICITLKKRKALTISIILVFIRMLPPLFFVALNLLIEMLNNKDYVMNISHLIYLMLRLSVGSLITNILNRNSIAKSNLLNEG